MLDALLHEVRLLDVSPKPLRRFGFLIGAILLVIGIWAGWKANFATQDLAGRLQVWTIVSFVALLFVILGAILPRALRPVYYLWMGIAIILGAVMTRVILTIVFVLLVVPVGLVMRALGRGAFHHGTKTPDDSFWIDRSGTVSSREQLEKYY